MYSRFATVATALYLLVFALACAYPLLDRRTPFSGLFAVLLGLPWIDYLPVGWLWLLLAVALNAFIIYALFTALAWLPALFRR